jgi:hypothetical protein
MISAWLARARRSMPLKPRDAAKASRSLPAVSASRLPRNTATFAAYSLRNIAASRLSPARVANSIAIRPSSSPPGSPSKQRVEPRQA